MGLNEDIVLLFDWYKHNNFEILSDRMMIVDGKTVSFKKYLTCSCTHQVYTKQGGICLHKRFFMMFPLIEYYIGNFEGLILEYSIGKCLPDAQVKLAYTKIVNDLTRLKDLR